MSGRIFKVHRSGKITVKPKPKEARHMLRIAIAGALMALGGVLWTGDRAEAQQAGCKVYTAGPDLVVGTTQTLPCNPDGLRVTNASPTVDQEVDLVEVGGIPISLGQKAMAASLPIVIASDQSAVPSNVTQIGGTAIVTGGIAGTQAVGGNIVADASATGSANPVPAGADYRATRPTYTDGDRTIAQSDTRGNLGVVLFSNNTGTALGSSAGGDTQGAPFGLQVVNYPEIWNGSSFDRQRSSAAGTGAALVELGPYTASRQTADGQVKATAGFVHTVSIAPTGAVTAGVITIYNSASETGTVLFSTALPVTTFTPFSVTLDVAAGTGIYVGFDATLANTQATVSFR